MKHRWAITAAIAVISFFSGGWLLQRGSGDQAVFRQARIFDDVLNHVRHFYVDSVPESELYKKATDGLLTELKDPYSVLLVEDDFKDLTEKTSGNYAGLGIQIDVRDGWITVVAPLPESPAERAGIQTGDQIIEVDGKSTQDWKSEAAVKALRGLPGSQVKIVVRRPGLADPMPYALTRAAIHVRSVLPGTMFDGGVGYISLNPVSETSANELQNEIAAMKKKGMKSMLLDLRNNPGGLLDQGVKVADLFLDPGQEIVSTRGRSRGATRQFFDGDAQLDPGLPIVVMVSEGTASAAEIIAGALQDHDRAVVVGTPSFGKGLVQTLYPLGESTALKLTTARWFTPSGRTIQRIATDEIDQVRQAMADVDPRMQRDSMSDSALKARPVFKTDAGRTVRGGGGIVPDVVVRPDTFTTPEREFVKAVGEKAAAYRDALTGYALELKQQKAIASENFTVTPAMRQAFYERLTKKGVAVTAATFDAASSFIDEQLGYEITRYSFGRQAENRRRWQDDPQLQEALRLLRRAATPKDLLTIAATASVPPSAN
jgi:carboxyl-terminal processing protease